jgi:hypothetical protein
MTAAKNRIMIFGPKDDGTYVVEFRTSGRRGAGNLDSAHRGARHPPRHFQERMPYGLFVPEVGRVASVMILSEDESPR